MKAESLNYRQFEARDIQNIFGKDNIDKNKLFYWIKTLRLLKPDIEEASGTGTSSKFSLKNLLELATIRQMRTHGIDYKSIQKIKRKLDRFNPKKKSDFNIFKKTFEEYFSKDTYIYIYQLENDIDIYLHTWIKKGGKEKLGYIPSDPEESDKISVQYTVTRLDIGKMAMWLKEKVDKI